MRKTADSLPARIAQAKPQKLRRITDMFLAAPIFMLAIISGIYTAYWRTAPLIRFTHMLWILGFWMTGTVAIFACIMPARARTGRRIIFFMFALFAIALAVYFTPLSRFINLFSSQTGLILPAAAGVCNIIISWLLVLLFRARIV